MDDFLKVLGVGLGLFIVAIVIAGVIPSAPGQPSLFSSDSSEVKNKTLMSIDVGAFGNLARSASYQPFPDVGVGYVQSKEILEKKGLLEIKNGLFLKSSKTFTFAGVETPVAYLTFYMNNSNWFGPLKVKFNGQDIYNNHTPEGSYLFELHDLKDENELTLSAGSSGITFWSPTIYRLTDLELTADRYSFKDNTYVFKVTPEEYNAWNSGRVAFILKEASAVGSLNIEINGHKVYANTSNQGKQVYVDFTKFGEDIVPGENTIHFYSERDGKYKLSNVQVIIFSNTGQNTILIKKFLFPAGPYYNYVKNDKGKIYFQLTGKRVSEGSLSLYVNDKIYSVPINSTTFDVVLPIKSEDLLPTFNELKFKTSGVYIVDTFNVVFNGTAQESFFSNRWSLTK